MVGLPRFPQLQAWHRESLKILAKLAGLIRDRGRRWSGREVELRARSGFREIRKLTFQMGTILRMERVTFNSHDIKYHGQESQDCSGPTRA